MARRKKRAAETVYVGRAEALYKLATTRLWEWLHSDGRTKPSIRVKIFDPAGDYYLEIGNLIEHKSPPSKRVLVP